MNIDTTLVLTTPPARGGHPFNPCHRHSCGRKGTLLLRRKEKISSQFNLPLGRKEYINRTSETLALGWGDAGARLGFPNHKFKLRINYTC